MDERDYTPGTTYNTDNSLGEADSQSKSATATATSVKENVKDNVETMKRKVSEQAADLKEKFNSQANTLGMQMSQKIDNARGKTSAGLRTTSQRIQNLAMYVEEHDAKDMSEAVVRNSQEVIRKHPGKSLLVGLLAGLVLGRILGFRR